jgi:RNA polymerase sigma-70 factor (ECF subfamily)
MASEPAGRAPPEPTPVLPRVARGEAAAIRECLARYGGLVISMARRLVPNDAEDAVQEAFVDVWRSAERFDPALGSEATFVAMVARRRLIDRVRRASVRREAPVAELPTAPDLSPHPDRVAEASIAAQALRKLRPEQKTVLMLSIYGGLSNEEIAKKTGMPLGTVKSHARRGLASIRAALLGVEEVEDKP